MRPKAARASVDGSGATVVTDTEALRLPLVLYQYVNCEAEPGTTIIEPFGGTNGPMVTVYLVVPSVSEPVVGPRNVFWMEVYDEPIVPVTYPPNVSVPPKLMAPDVPVLAIVMEAM
jgi:hypothetical protein